MEVETVGQRGPTTSEVVEAALTLKNFRRQYLENKDKYVVAMKYEYDIAGCRYHLP